MNTLLVRDLFQDKILISREAARLLEVPLRAAMEKREEHDAPAGMSVRIDFQGIEGVAPSFVDELILVLEQVVRPYRNGKEWSLTIANPPTRLSSKFEAIARGHSMSIRALDDGSWLFETT